MKTTVVFHWWESKLCIEFIDLSFNSQLKQNSNFTYAFIDNLNFCKYFVRICLDQEIEFHSTGK